MIITVTGYPCKGWGAWERIGIQIIIIPLLSAREKSHLINLLYLVSIFSFLIWGHNLIFIFLFPNLVSNFLILKNGDIISNSQGYCKDTVV